MGFEMISKCALLRKCSPAQAAHEWPIGTVISYASRYYVDLVMTIIYGKLILIAEGAYRGVTV